MVECSVDLGEKNKLTGANYLDWKSKISSILQLKHLLRRVLKKEAANEAVLADNPSEFWRLLEEHYQPKSIQNQATYLNRIFTTVLNSNDLEATLATLSYNTQQLCALIDDTKTKPSALLDTIIAMWCIINLPSKYKNSGELLPKKCQIEKKSPTIKEVVKRFACSCNKTPKLPKPPKLLLPPERPLTPDTYITDPNAPLGITTPRPLWYTES
ncbi:hypothetical protein Pst134EA_015570 [Puccinia striiformis f. sp. tritici]|uniref:hypothetical protein n=1 Tax=Puccinia striiformis f. sp. tritici TaxID=168172 RepID=UPI002007AA4B|nr:hypothetical protein Pst134EA_015570 [Puccinia striiformis f. sp. tritici]KAH9463487.1 hypothetical protein Pst134EA_015570 [Puccinia striiformis f. sp. tritici]